MYDFVLRPQAALLVLSLLLTAAMPALGQTPPLTAPEEVGMSAERLERITRLGERYVDDGKLAGIVTMVARHGELVHFEAAGTRDLDSGAPMTRDTLFRIYSMSKPITAVAAMMLYEEGKFQLSDPVSEFLPELADLEVWEDGETVEPEREMTMHHLLTHTAGFSYGFDPEDPVDRRYGEVELLQSRDLEEFVAQLAELPLRYHPGSRWHYSVAVDVTGAVIERLSGQSFDAFLRERLFEPLGMEDTFFAVPDEKRDRLGTNHRWDAEAEELVVLPAPDYPNWQDTTFFSGGGGLISTAADYMRFAEMLRNGGSLDGTRILSPKTIEYMTRDHLPAVLDDPGEDLPTPQSMSPGVGFGLGFGVQTDATRAGVIGSPGEYWWGGAAGTLFWIDPVEELVVIGMVQLMDAPWPLRSEIKVLSNQAITELER